MQKEYIEITTRTIIEPFWLLRYFCLYLFDIIYINLWKIEVLRVKYYTPYTANRYLMGIALK